MTPNSPPALTFLFPVYNEQERLAATLAALSLYVQTLDVSCDVLFVDDGSTDDSVRVIKQWAGNAPCPARVVGDGKNRGKGWAIHRGLQEASGDVVLFTDADLSVPLSETPRFLAAIDAGADIAIGSRRMEGAALEERQPLLRESMGSVFRFLTRSLVVGRDITDVTCGFKAFRRETARFLAAKQTIWDWSFDAELLFLARRFGKKVANVPVRWRHQEGTKVRLLRDALRSLGGLAAIRANDARGVYGRLPSAD